MNTVALPHNRIATIIGHEEARGRELLAEHLARQTVMMPEDAIAVLRAAPRSADPAGAAASAAAASAATARLLLGMAPNAEADAEIGRRAASFETARAEDDRRIAAERAAFEADYAAGKAEAERILGKRH